MKVDKVIFGAGIYGLYAALYCARKKESVVVLEYDKEAFSRATYINQARVHNGYHYPRSFSTALKSAGYFERFNKDFNFAINGQFRKIYATSSRYSWTSAEQFQKFCNLAKIKCEEVNPANYFNNGLVDGAFITEEHTFDAMMIKQFMLHEIASFPNVKIIYNARIDQINKTEKNYNIGLKDNRIISTDFVLNTTYASTNQIADRFGLEKFKIKYELCEVILCNVSNNLSDVGITIMDGPFFSVMPFGKSGLHSLTSVTFTPHFASYDELPTFTCQDGINCSPKQLSNCNMCINKPGTSWNYMHALTKKYLSENITIEYKESLFSIKPILMTSEIDDSRPTVIKTLSYDPTFISVLSGKINTIYDLEEVLDKAALINS